MARKIRDGPGTIKAQTRTCILTWAFMWERVTGIEPALSAWESTNNPRSAALTWVATYP